MLQIEWWSYPFQGPEGAAIPYADQRNEWDIGMWVAINRVPLPEIGPNYEFVAAWNKIQESVWAFMDPHPFAVDRWDPKKGGINGIKHPPYYYSHNPKTPLLFHYDDVLPPHIWRDTWYQVQWMRGSTSYETWKGHKCFHRHLTWKQAMESSIQLRLNLWNLEEDGAVQVVSPNPKHPPLVVRV